MAAGQNHNKSGHSKSMGTKNGKTFSSRDEYVRRPSGPQAAVQPPEMQDALQAVKNVLDDLEMCVIEFFSDG